MGMPIVLWAGLGDISAAVVVAAMKIIPGFFAISASSTGTLYLHA
jgi:hypothetical protein